jgi:23S rRNA pseudouridine1911/1915/1917 synthase
VNADHRTVTIPDGMAGERLDSALSRMFGLSRTRAAELIADGHVLVEGVSTSKSDRVSPGEVLDVTIPTRIDQLEVVPEIVEGIKIIHDDDSIVVIDKPVGSPYTPRPGGRGRPSWATWREPASGSPPAGPRSGRGSCSGSTSAPRG